MKRGRILIVGGSLGGLMAGSILCKEGWDVRIFERVADEIAGRGAGIATHTKLFEVLGRAGARIDDEMGMALVGRSAFDHSGKEIAHFPFRQILSPWGLLYRRLREALPDSCYKTGMDVRAVQTGSHGASLQFADGSRESGDIVIGADGIWSQIRNDLFPATVPKYCGYVAWRGVVDEGVLDPTLTERFAPLHSFYIERGEQFILYAINGLDDSLQIGKRRFGFLWYRAVDQNIELPNLLTEIDGTKHAHSIPPPRIDPRHISEMRRLAATLLPPQFADVVNRTPHPFLQPIFDLKSKSIRSKRAVLLGDAAFVARPHVGAGVLKAACDAIELADSLKSNASIDAALQQYERKRLADGAAMVDKSRYLGGYLESRENKMISVLPVEEVLRDSGRGLFLDGSAQHA